MEFWHLPINLSAQIAPDYISEYLNFQNFLDPPSLGLFLWVLTRPYCISPQYAQPRLTNKKMPKNAPVKEWRLANNVREKY